jgi:mono/diheme cytochrome c family protein
MKVLKIVGIVLGAVVGLVVVGVAIIYVLSNARLGRTHPRPRVAIVVPTTPDAVTRGKHLVEAVGSCMECHGEDLGGKVVMDAGPIGVVVAANLTRGRGGVATSFQDADWVYAIRHGLRQDRTSLILMPSEAYARLTDNDLGAIVAYLKQVPPVDRELPPSKLPVLGRALLLAGKLPLLAAENTPDVQTRAAAQPGPTAEYGHYLAGVSGCTGCHGSDLTGGLTGGPPGTPPSANLTPAALGSWSEADFFRLMRTGVRPDGRKIGDFMPWRFMARMSDDELRALWLYLQTVAAKETPTAQ